MSRILKVPTAGAITIADELFALSVPPTQSVVMVPETGAWGDGGVPAQVDLEIWANLPVNLTAATFYIGTLHPLVNADDTFTAANATEIFTAAAHGLFTGDGPFRLTTTGALPTGLATGTDYYFIRIDANTFYLALSRALALAGTFVSISTDGTGVQTISDTADTQRVYWHNDGLLGPAGDGAIALTAQAAYTKRIDNNPRAMAYGVSATLDVNDPEWVSAAIYPVLDVA